MMSVVIAVDFRRILVILNLRLGDLIKRVTEREFSDVFDYCKWATECGRELAEKGSKAFGVLERNVVKKRG